MRVLFRPSARTMQNSDGVRVDLYIPRRCAATNQIIGAEDHASVSINIGNVDEHGRFTGRSLPIVLGGAIRNSSNSDAAVNRIATKAGYLKDVMPKNTYFG